MQFIAMKIRGIEATLAEMRCSLNRSSTASDKTEEGGEV